MRNRGFSIIELMIVVAIIGVLLMLVSPGVKDWMVNLRIRNAATAIDNGLQLARQEAIKRNQNIAFWLVTESSGNTTSLDNTCALSDTSGSWVVSVKSPSGKCASDLSTTVDPMLVAKHAVGDGASGVSFSATQSDGSTAANCVVFNGLGRTTTDAALCASSLGRIDVQSSSNTANYRSLCIEISGGSVKTCDPALGSSDPRACKGACS